jgi:hypothetical protein
MRCAYDACEKGNTTNDLSLCVKHIHLDIYNSRFGGEELDMLVRAITTGGGFLPFTSKSATEGKADVKKPEVVTHDT